ncbi:replication initiation factor domain-containing protein, partial [Methylicorpusculum sp.]|uniref:replication initiation factor domain-containing protein n=1 Tax=Methylicorpusculum sp. TaxID=2713644 RepID=UPI002AB8E272
KTTIDWLAFRTRSTHFQAVEAMLPMFGSASDLVTFRPGMKGKDGWMYAGEILMAGDITLGRIDYGGESQRGWIRINLTGQGCDWVQDWAAAVNLQNLLQEAQIKRLDIALTTNLGEVNDQSIVDAHAAGMFTCGGRPPSMRSITSSDPRAGRTRYIGSRQSHKFLRCYEKGFELIKDVPFLKDTITHIEGFKVEDIYRVELELKDVDKLIPWETITGRDQVFAGSYPFCSALLPGVPHWRMLTLPDLKPKAALETALNHCRVAYGPTLRAALMAYNGDSSKLMERVLAESPSHALVEAGVLTVSHG